MKKPPLNDDGHFQIFLKRPKKTSRYPKYDLSSFSKDTNKIELLFRSFDADTSVHFARNKNDAIKVHSKHDVDLIFDLRKGSLFLNSNGAAKGFGKEGGLIARITNFSDIESSDFLFSNSGTDEVGELPEDPVTNPETNQHIIKNNFNPNEGSKETKSVVDSESSTLSNSSSSNSEEYNYGYRGGRYSRLPEENNVDYETGINCDTLMNPII